jgi:hypothetical protein
MLLGMLASDAGAQTSRPARPAKRQSPIQEAIKFLVEEAQQAKRDLKLPSNTADFAPRFDREISDHELIGALTQSLHDDSFIDAYIRWQLTSFDPDPPELDDRQFLKLMANAPAMVQNPRADEQVVALFQKAEQSGSLSHRELDRLRQAASELDRRTQIAQAMNLPAEGYRDWIASKLTDGGPRRLQWLIERCAGTITAGWPSRSIKAAMTKQFKAVANDNIFTPSQRQLIAEQLRRLIGLKRVSVNKITFLAGNTVQVTFSTTAVDEDDVEKWIAQLNGEIAD